MNRNDKEYLVQKIRTQYKEKENTQLDSLRVLDAKVKRPANIFAGVFGALIMGFGMAVIALAYPVYRHVVKKERERIAPEVIRLTDQLMK